MTHDIQDYDQCEAQLRRAAIIDGVMIVATFVACLMLWSWMGGASAVMPSVEKVVQK